VFVDFSAGEADPPPEMEHPHEPDAVLSFDDTIRGADGNDLVLGMRGDDVIDGGDGDDWLAGDSGNDGSREDSGRIRCTEMPGTTS
jgi:hypothetical protein